MTELRGSLEGIGLPPMVHFLAGLHKSGCLHASHHHWTGEVYFESGQVVAASFGAARGVAALEEMVLVLTSGHFTFSNDVPPPEEQNIHLATEELQAHLDGLVAQHANLPQIISSTEAVPRLVEPIDQENRSGRPDQPGKAGEIVLDRSTLQTLLAVDGRRTVEEIARDHPAQTVKELATLMELGLIRVDVPGASQPPPGEPLAPALRQRYAVRPPEVAEVRLDPAPEVAWPANRAGSPEATVGEPHDQTAGVATGLPSPRAPTSPLATIPGPCPRLGFVDDPSNCYSRPTQLHRCFASAKPERVPTQIQQELCLADQFAICARFLGELVPPASPEALRRTPGGVSAVPAPYQPALQGAPGAPALPAIEPSQVIQATEETQEIPVMEWVPVFEPAAGNDSRPALVIPVTNRKPDRALERSRPLSSDAASPTVAAARMVADAPCASATPVPLGGRAREAQPLPVVEHADEAQSPASQTVKTHRSRAGTYAQAVARRPVQVILFTLLTVLGLLTLMIFRAPQASQERASRASVQDAAGPLAGAPAAGASLRTVVDERFANNQRNWPNNPQSTAWLANGAYRMFARQPGQFVSVGAGIDRYRDVIVSGNFRKLSGPGGGGYALILRDQGPGPRDGINQGGQYYVFEVGDPGEVGIWRRDGQRWVELLPWTRSEAVRLGDAANELRVQAIGQQMTFFVNGVQVASQTDATLSEGGVGLFVGGDFNEVVVDRFLVQVPN